MLLSMLSKTVCEGEADISLAFGMTLVPVDSIVHQKNLINIINGINQIILTNLNIQLKMMKQKYANGYWIGLTSGVCPKCLSLYHFVPFAFVSAIIASGSVIGATGLAECIKKRHNHTLGKGISALILQQLLNEAHYRGISKVALHTTKSGEKLYRKFGFSDPIYPVLELCL